MPGDPHRFCRPEDKRRRGVPADTTCSFPRLSRGTRGRAVSISGIPPCDGIPGETFRGADHGFRRRFPQREHLPLADGEEPFREREERRSFLAMVVEIRRKAQDARVRMRVIRVVGEGERLLRALEGLVRVSLKPQNQRAVTIAVGERILAVHEPMVDVFHRIVEQARVKNVLLAIGEPPLPVGERSASRVRFEQVLGIAESSAPRARVAPRGLARGRRRRAPCSKERGRTGLETGAGCRPACDRAPARARTPAPPPPRHSRAPREA